MICILVGCEGKSLVDDNPVFAEAPPRGALTNKATVVAQNEDGEPHAVRTVSATVTVGGELNGNSVVATVNGKPIFLDDLIGSLRLSIEADERITPEQKQKIFYAQVKGRLPAFVEQEIVLQKLNQSIPKERQASIDETLETPFQEVVSNIKRDRNVETDAQLDELLAAEGLSIDLLRESFIRIQKVQGYLSTLATPPETIDRIDMVEYYQEHREEFTTNERIRWQEIVVLFSDHGGKDAAAEHMAKVISDLENKKDFGETAMKYSDSLSAERRGDMGWLESGGLADKQLESALFSLESGEMTDVYTRDDRFELYRVVDHQRAQTTPFTDVQTQIEKQLKQQAARKAREEALENLRDAAIVITMFDNEPTDAENTVKPVSNSGGVQITR